MSFTRSLRRRARKDYHMTIDFSQTITKLNGQVFPDDDGQPLTLGRAAANALGVVNVNPDSSQPLTPKEARERRKLAKRLHGSSMAEVSLDEAAMIQKILVRAYAPAVSGEACDMIEAAGNSHSE